VIPGREHKSSLPLSISILQKYQKIKNPFPRTEKIPQKFPAKHPTVILRQFNVLLSSTVPGPYAFRQQLLPRELQSVGRVASPKTEKYCCVFRHNFTSQRSHGYGFQKAGVLVHGQLEFSPTNQMTVTDLLTPRTVENCQELPFNEMLSQKSIT
jgi:hypothetical protein